MKNFLSKKVILFTILLLAIFIRFLYFPENTYFGFDQARDAYQSQEILKGNLKIVGPPTANQILHHGVLYYYVYAPIYFFGEGDPAIVSAFLRLLNAFGVVLIFLITYIMFNRLAALLASFLFAISFEQTQFSLFLNHPSFAVISVLIFYLGLSLWIFKKKYWGLVLAFFGLGLSIQFEFVEAQLIAVFILFLIFFRKSTNLDVKKILIGLLAFLIPVSPFIISELRHNFYIINQVPTLAFNPSSESFIGIGLAKIPFFINRHIHDNLISSNILISLIEILFFVIVIKLLLKSIYRKQIVFLLLWFFGGFLVYFFTENDAYFYNTGTSIAILVFTSFLFSSLYTKSKLIVLSLLIAIFISNMMLITQNNPLGPNEKINPQKGLLLKDELRIIDFIYQNAHGEDFAVNALTMPYNVNTTWSYLFEWYGAKNYGYVPIWGGDAAEGFEGGLKVNKVRSTLPKKRYLVIEPTEGIPSYLIYKFLKEEESFSKVIEKRNIGTMQVWVQQPK